MKYSAGQKVRIKSYDWYKSQGDYIPSWLCPCCGRVFTIDVAYMEGYAMKEIQGVLFKDIMIEGLADLSQEEFAEQWSNFDFNEAISKTLEGKAWKEHEAFVKLVAKFRNIATACEIAEMRIKYLKENVMEVPLALFEEHATAMNKYIELENKVDDYLESKGY